MNIVDISVSNLWNLDRPHFELLAWDVHNYYGTDETTNQINGRYCAIEIILCSFKLLVTIEL